MRLTFQNGNGMSVTGSDTLNGVGSVRSTRMVMSDTRDVATPLLAKAVAVAHRRVWCDGSSASVTRQTTTGVASLVTLGVQLPNVPSPGPSPSATAYRSSAVGYSTLKRPNATHRWSPTWRLTVRDAVAAILSTSLMNSGPRERSAVVMATGALLTGRPRNSCRERAEEIWAQR